MTALPDVRLQKVARRDRSRVLQRSAINLQLFTSVIFTENE